MATDKKTNDAALNDATGEAGTVTDTSAPKADNPTPDAASGNVLEGNAPDGISLTEAEAAKARKEGAKEAAKESAKNTYQYLTDGNLPGAQLERQWHGSSDIMQFEPLLDQGPDEFAKTISEDAEVPMAEEKVAGLYKLERNGKNRTPYVQALRKRLALKEGEDVPGAGGPPYTNDIAAARTPL